MVAPSPDNDANNKSKPGLEALDPVKLQPDADGGLVHLDRWGEASAKSGLTVGVTLCLHLGVRLSSLKPLSCFAHFLPSPDWIKL